MKSVLENITVLFIKGQAPLDSQGRVTETKQGFFSFTYGSGMNAYGFWNYANSSSVAGGGGYAKDGVCLAEVVNKEFGTNYKNSGEGLEHTIRQMKADGFQVKHMYEVFDN